MSAPPRPSATRWKDLLRAGMQLARLLACALLSGPYLAVAAADSAPPPNIVLILADDLGYGDLGCYGQKQIRTPHLDRLAAEGRRYTQFYAGSTVCAPSRCALMTGKHTGHAYIRGNSRDSLPEAEVTLAETLRSAGYATGLVGKWGLGQEGSTGLPTRQGFDRYFGFLDQHHAHNYYPAFLIRGEERVPLDNVVPGDGPYGAGVATVRKQYAPDLLIEEALRFVDDHRSQRFFLCFTPTLPHANNEAKQAGMEIPDYGAYADQDWPTPQKGLAAMITRLDADVGRLLERLRAHGLERQTLVLFSSDNGPHAEGGNNPDFFDSNGPLRGIKRDLYEGGIRVPFLVRWPGRVPAGSVSDAVGSFVDLLPTLTEIGGGRAPEGLDGVSLRAEFAGDSAAAKHFPRKLYWEFYERGSGQAVRAGDWKIIRRPLGGDQFEVYNLAEDPGETQDVAAEQGALIAQTRSFMDEAHVPSPLWKIPARAPQRRP